jgi:hypothetical protein
MKTAAKKYGFLVVVLAVNFLVLAIRPETGSAAFTFTDGIF